jgi:hypothetical protein
MRVVFSDAALSDLEAIADGSDEIPGSRRKLSY